MHIKNKPTKQIWSQSNSEEKWSEIPIFQRIGFEKYCACEIVQHQYFRSQAEKCAKKKRDVSSKFASNKIRFKTAKFVNKHTSEVLQIWF